MKLTKKNKIAILNKNANAKNDDAKWLQIAKWNSKHKDALEDYLTIAIRIQSTLKEKKMTQTQLAGELDVTPQALTRIMKGRQNLTLNKVRQIERILGIAIMAIQKEEKSSNKLRTKMVPVVIYYQDIKASYINPINIHELNFESNQSDSEKIAERAERA